MNMLSRNLPVALIVGAAGFLGSHLVEKLLDKGIQVIGVDDLSTGKITNLENASRNKEFHFLKQSASEPIKIEVDRLDYVFIVISDDIPPHIYLPALRNILSWCRRFKPKILLVSSVDLYDSKSGDIVLKKAESEVAEFALKNNINARVLRLSAVFGPRMRFTGSDPIIRLIHAAVLNQVKEESTALDFMSRALYVDEAVDLIIKTIMHGSTAQKIYDGLLFSPIKLMEIKQILVDPLWYENRGFTPTEMPPWPTPNLEKTMKELSWHPDVNIIKALKETLKFFQDHPEYIGVGEYHEIERDKGSELRIKGEEEGIREEELKVREEKKEEKKAPKLHLDKDKLKRELMLGVGIVLIVYGLIYPLIRAGWDGYKVWFLLGSSQKMVQKPDFQQAGENIKTARWYSDDLNDALSPILFLGSIGQLKDMSFLKEIGDLNKLIKAQNDLILGMSNLYSSLAIISGEREGSINEYLSNASVELNTAEQRFTEIIGNLDGAKSGQFKPFSAFAENVYKKLEDQKRFISLNIGIINALPLVAPVGGKTVYLIGLVDNSTMYPGSGPIISLAKVSFNNGKVGKVEVESGDSLNKKITINLPPPPEIKNDLGKGNLFFSDLTFDSDFPANARTIESYYSKYSKEDISGLVFLDITTLNRLLKLTGPVQLTSHRQVDDNNFISEHLNSKDGIVESEVLKEVVQRIVLAPRQNWMGLVNLLSQSQTEKHLLIHITNPKLAGLIKRSDVNYTVPAQLQDKVGERSEFLALTETDISPTGFDFYLKRDYFLQSTINENGEVFHKLEVAYQTTNPASILNSGRYSFRLKVYLPAGTRLNEVKWGDQGILSGTTQFSDYGRAGYSMKLDFAGGSKRLSLVYQDANPLDFKAGSVKYAHDFVKQLGQGSDKLEYRLILPTSIKSDAALSFSSDLASDRSYKFTLQKIR